MEHLKFETGRVDDKGEETNVQELGACLIRVRVLRVHVLRIRVLRIRVLRIRVLRFRLLRFRVPRMRVRCAAPAAPRGLPVRVHARA